MNELGESWLDTGLVVVVTSYAYHLHGIMRKLIIQIPCHNEEQNLPETLKCLTRQVEGFDKVEWLIINDGSIDQTEAVARKLGVDHIVSFPTNRGLAEAFKAGIRASCAAGADVIVNTDADNQYDASWIPNLLKPILDGEADMVIGERPIELIEDFSWLKKKLQRIGSFVVRWISSTEVRDATSGFRAFTREGAMHLNVFNQYTYTLETIIQGGLGGIRIASVPVQTNRKTRESRLVRSIQDYIARSIGTMFSIFSIYRPVRTFMLMGSIPIAGGILLGLRWLIYFSSYQAASIPSLILASILLVVGFQLWVLALVSHLLSVNRQLMQDIQYEVRKKFWLKL